MKGLFKRGAKPLRDVLPPLLSIIVPAFDVEKFLGECLDSLQTQSLRDIEIIVIDDGSPDKIAAITKRHAKSDPRVRLIRQANQGVSAARNAGIEASRGRYLTFVDPDDIVLTDGFRDAVQSLEASGADWAVLPYRQFDRAGNRDIPPWVAEIFAQGLRTVKPGEVPAITVHTNVAAKVYRREFWDRAGMGFRPDVRFEDQEVAARAYAYADTIDIVPTESYLWRLRGGSFTREASETTMRYFFDAIRNSFEHLDRIPGAVTARAGQLLANDVPRYLRALVKVDDAGYASELFDGIEFLWPLVDREIWRRDTPAEGKILEWLVCNGRRSDVAAFVAADGFTLANHPFELLPEGPALRLPFFDDATVPREAFVLSERQTPADARALRVVLNESGVDLEIMAYLRHLDTGQPSARAWLVADGVDVAELELTHVDTFVGHRLRTTRASNERSIWRTGFDWSSVPESAASVELMVRVEVTHLGRTESTVLALIDPAGSAAWPQRAGRWQWAGAEPARWFTGDAIDTVAPAIESPVSVLDLPLDTPDGWWGFDGDKNVVWTELPAAEREHAAFWWQRDFGLNGQS